MKRNKIQITRNSKKVKMNDNTPNKIIRKVKDGLQISGNYKHPEMKVKGIKINKIL